ncbi:hypothetical protein AAHC03_01874 [Spirometra sp. Aus1]
MRPWKLHWPASPANSKRGGFLEVRCGCVDGVATNAGVDCTNAEACLGDDNGSEDGALVFTVLSDVWRCYGLDGLQCWTFEGLYLVCRRGYTAR